MLNMAPAAEIKTDTRERKKEAGGRKASVEAGAIGKDGGQM